MRAPSTPATSPVKKSLVNRCDIASCAESSWVTVSDEAGDYEFRVPATLRRVAVGKYSFVHGGEVWEDGELSVSIVYGIWDEYSFDGTMGNRCRTTLDGNDVFVIAAPRDVLAWYQIAPGSHEPVLSARSKVDDSSRLAGIAMSLRVRKSRAP
jgi:hypothetical protein